MKFKLPLIVLISIIVLILLSVQGAVLFYVSFKEIDNDIRRKTQEDLKNLVHSQQGVLEYFYQNNKINELQKQISSIGSDVHVNLAVLLNDEDIIIASTKLALRGEVFDYKKITPNSQSLQRDLEASKTSLKNYLAFIEKNQYLLVAQPIVLGTSAQSIRPDRVGLLIIHYDLGWIQSQVISGFLSQQTSIWLSLILVIAGLGAVIYWGIIKRIKHITNVAAKVSEGDHSMRAKISGADEISYLASFFNEMLDSMEAHQNVLSNAFDELTNRDQNLTMTLQSIGDAVIVTDAEENITRMNLAARELTGWSEFDAVGRPLKQIFNIVDADTRKPINNPIEDVMKTGQVIELGEHTMLISKTGHEYHISDSAAPIKDDRGAIHGVIMVFQDITEEYNLQKALKEGEQRLRMALEATEEGLWDWNIESGSVYYSSRWIHMLGYNSGEILPDISTWKRIIHPDDVVEVMSKLQAHLKGGDPVFEAEHRLKMKTGSYLWVLGRGKVTEYDNNGKPLRVVGTLSDISLEKEHEEQMRRAQKMEAMGKLTGGIAHDYNNMLGVILGYAELMQMQVSNDSKQAMYVESIIRAAERGKKLTNSLLKFSRRKETEAEAVNINRVLKDDEHMLSKTLTARVQLKMDLLEELWPTYLDDGDLEDALLNLTINAMHAMSDEGTLTIATNNEFLDTNFARTIGVESGEYVCLSITDTGGGMDEDTIDHIFDPFFSTKGDLGTGLGLSQVYGFVQRSGGGIRVSSQLNVGTQFSLYFPRYYVNVSKQAEKKQNRIENFQGNETILVVDDEQSLRGLAEEVLTMNGYKVLQAQDAVQALNIMANNTVDLMVSDVIMPGMNGYQLAQEVINKYPKTKIQMVSGFNAIENSVDVIEELQKNQLRKPFNSNELLKHVRDLLNEDKAEAS